MSEPCEKRDEVGEIVDDGLDMLPPPVSGIAKVLRRLGSLFIGRERRRRKAKAARQRKWEQAAGRARDASSDATEAAERKAWGTDK